MTRVIKLTMIVDVICPFCYIGHMELLKAIKECSSLPVSFEIECRPFRLLTTFSDDEPSVDRVSYLKARLGEEGFAGVSQKVEKWKDAQQCFDGPQISMNGIISSSTRAHRLMMKAFEVGGQMKQQAVLLLLLKAFNIDNKDVSDVNVLADCAIGAGLMSREQAVMFIQSDEWKAQVEEMSAEARVNGVTGVPFTVIEGRWAVSGSQSAEAYSQIFRKLATCGAGASLPPTPKALHSLPGLVRATA